MNGGQVAIPECFAFGECLASIHFDLIDLYFELRKQIIHTIYNELTVSGKRGSSNVSNMLCALEYKFQFIQKF